MRYSLWAGDKYVQSSNDVNVLKCNTNQLKYWCSAMSIDTIPEHLSIKDNDTVETLAVFHARYKFGGRMKWRDAPKPTASEVSFAATPRFHRAPRPKLVSVYAGAAGE